jgi:sugar diacid utilization regulator
MDATRSVIINSGENSQMCQFHEGKQATDKKKVSATGSISDSKTMCKRKIG